MPLTGDGQRSSPRDAIRQWLQRADADRQNDQEVLHSTHDPSNVMQADRGSNHRLKRSSAKHTASNLAESLGLRAPFRNLASVESQETHHGRSKDHRRKRRRRSTSESSFLEPAVAVPTSRGVRIPHGSTKRQEPDPSCSSSDSGSDIISDTRIFPPAVASKRPEKTYERRPRHKTREDRYEPKVSRKEEKRHRQKDVKRSSKRKRAKKTAAGMAYDHGFEGTSANRLTLRPAQGLGIFKRGRASSPIRRGLPDLTFSEMGFLASRRDKSKEVNSNLTKGRREKDRGAGTEDEISRFFSSGKQVLAERDMNRQDKQHDEAAYPHDKAHGHAKRAVSRRSDRRQSPHPPIELPEKPFLGFGNRGAHSFPAIESHGPIGETALSGTPSGVTQHTPSRSTTSYTWSRSGIESNSTSLKRHEGVVQPSGFPVVSTASNPAAPSIEVGQLCPASNPELRLPDTQTILSPEKPRPSRSSAESRHHLRPKIAAYQPHSQPVVNAARLTEAGKTYHETSKQHEPVENSGGEREQQPADMRSTRTTDNGHDLHNVPTEAERRPVPRHEPETQVQHLESLLDACKTTLSGLAKIGYDPLTLRATKPPTQPASVGLTEALSVVNARTKDQTQLRPGVAKAKYEKQETLPGESKGDITRSPRQRAARPSNPMGLGEESFPKDPEDAPGAEPMERHTRQPLRSTCGVHTQARASCSAATAFNHRIAGLESHELQDTRTPLAESKVFNPHQSSRFAYVNADAEQSSGRSDAFQHSREGDSTDWVGSSRHTPLRPGARTLPDSNHGIGDGQLWTAYGTSYTRPMQSPDVEVAPHIVQDESLLDDIETQRGYHRDSIWYENQSMSPANHHRDHMTWQGEFTDDILPTDMREDVFGEDVPHSQEVGIERDVNHLGPVSDTDERPMTRFWHPHRLY